MPSKKKYVVAAVLVAVVAMAVWWRRRAVHLQVLSVAPVATNVNGASMLKIGFHTTNQSDPANWVGRRFHFSSKAFGSVWSKVGSAGGGFLTSDFVKVPTATYTPADGDSIWIF